MPRYYIKSPCLQTLCCGDVMITRRKVMALLVTLAMLSTLTLMLLTYTLAREFLHSNNSLITRVRQTGVQYKDRVLHAGQSYVKPIQARLQKLQPLQRLSLETARYEEKLKDVYQSAQQKVKVKVRTLTGKADTVIKQVKKDPGKFAEEAKDKVLGFAKRNAGKAKKAVEWFGQESMEKIGDLGQKSVDRIKAVGQDTKELVEAMRNHPEKYQEKVKQQYREAYKTVQNWGERTKENVGHFNEEAKERIQHITKSTQDLVKDFRRNPDKYGVKARTQFSKLETQAQQSAADGIKDLKQKAAAVIQPIQEPVIKDSVIQPREGIHADGVPPKFRMKDSSEQPRDKIQGDGSQRKYRMKDAQKPSEDGIRDAPKPPNMGIRDASRRAPRRKRVRIKDSWKARAEARLRPNPDGRIPPEAALNDQLIDTARQRA